MNTFIGLPTGPGMSPGYGAPIGGVVLPGFAPDDFWTNFEKGFKQPWRVGGEAIGELLKGFGGEVRATIDGLGPYSVPLMIGGGGLILVMILLLTKL